MSLNLAARRPSLATADSHPGNIARREGFSVYRSQAAAATRSPCGAVSGAQK